MDIVHHYDRPYWGLYIEKFRSIMKSYTFKFRKRDSEQRVMTIREFVTFPEAASWSYIKSSKLGPDWYVESVSEKQ